LHKTRDVVERDRTREQFGGSLGKQIVAVEQHTELQRMAVFRVVQIIAEGVDRLDLIAGYHQPLESRDPSGDVDLSYRLVGCQGVAWTNQVGVRSSARAEIRAAEGESGRIEQ